MITVWQSVFVPSYPCARQQEDTASTLPRGRQRCTSESQPFHTKNIFPLSHNRLVSGDVLGRGKGVWHPNERIYPEEGTKKENILGLYVELNKLPVMIIGIVSG